MAPPGKEILIIHPLSILIEWVTRHEIIETLVWTRAQLHRTSLSLPVWDDLNCGIKGIPSITTRATGDQILEKIFSRTDFSQFFHEAGKAEAGNSRILSEGSVTGYPLLILHRSGRITWFKYNSEMYKDNVGIPRGQTSESYEDNSWKPPPEKKRKINPE